MPEKPTEKIPCDSKHTAYQPPDEVWLCPKCGADTGSFIIDNSADDANSDCSLLHEDDEVRCLACHDGWSGKQIAKKLMTINHRKVCPTCKGAGSIPEEP